MYSIRNNCVICNNNILYELYCFTNFPIKFTLTNKEGIDYIMEDISINFCSICNTIQINKLINLNILYDSPHNNNIIGKKWQNHYIEFSKFIIKNTTNLNKVLEIGSGTDKIVRFFNNDYYDNWFLMDPNINHYNNSKIKYINKIFDEDFNTTNNKYNTIINSHLLEHLHTPQQIIKKMNEVLEPNGTMFISIPNLEYYSIDSNPLMGLNFEHTYFINEMNFIYLMNSNNFEICDKQLYNDHSIFYYVKKIDQPLIDNIDLKLLNIYNKSFINLFKDKIAQYSNYIKCINDNISNKSNIYLFACHPNSQFLLNMGLNIINIHFILDNDESKHDKILYGTKLVCKSPNIISNLNNPIVICPPSPYLQEITSQLKSINKNIIII